MESCINNTDSIPCHPFLSSSRHFIQYFALIGYHQSIYRELIKDSNISNNKYTPSILSSITSMNNTDENWSNAIILRQLYPYNPSIIPISNNLSNSIKKETSRTSMVFSINFNTNKIGDNKCQVMCYAYLFYEKYKNHHIPKAFCIISEYPFFSTFKCLCEELWLTCTMNKQLKFPIEFYICIIVNCYPSPINNNYKYKFFENPTSIPLTKISGYPYIDFNLSVLFNYLPKSLIIKIYTMTIVEMNIVFFSGNLEALNIIMYIFSILNFPCNDSNYSWHIVSISKENFINENKTQFSSKPYSSILGVYASYDDIIKENKKPKRTMSYIAVDIDNRKIFFKGCKEKNEMAEEKNFYKIYNYIEKITNFSFKLPSFLKKNLNELSMNIDKILESNEYDSLEMNFLKTSQSIKVMNFKFQSAFYNCTLNILRVFYLDIVKELYSEEEQEEYPIENESPMNFKRIKDGKVRYKTMTPQAFKIKRNSEEKINNDDVDDDNDKDNEDIKVFKYEFMGTIQYNSFFLNYIKAFQCSPTSRIALLFSEEFLALKGFKLNYNHSKSYLDMINYLYDIEKDQELEKYTLVNCYPFCNKKVLCNNGDNNYDIEDKLGKKSKIISFNQHTILNYLHYLNEIQNETFILFLPFYKQVNAPLKMVTSESIHDLIEEVALQDENKKGNEMILEVFVYLIGILIIYNNDRLEKKLAPLIALINRLEYKGRKYIIIILRFMVCFLIKNKNSETYKKDKEIIIKNVYSLKMQLKKSKIMPNERLSKILNFIENYNEDNDGNNINNHCDNNTICSIKTEENADDFAIKYSKSNKEMILDTSKLIINDREEREGRVQINHRNSSNIIQSQSKLLSYLRSCRTKNGNIKESSIYQWAYNEKTDCYYDIEKMKSDQSNLSKSIPFQSQPQSQPQPQPQPQPELRKTISSSEDVKEPKYCVVIKTKMFLSKICSPLKLLIEIRNISNDYFLKSNHEDFSNSFNKIANMESFQTILINCIFYLNNKDEVNDINLLLEELHIFYQKIVRDYDLKQKP